MFDGKGFVPVHVMEDIAKAIRSKMKEQNLYKPTEMAAAIRSMTPYFYDATGTFYILSPDHWTIHVNQSEHQTISYNASGEAVMKGVDKWASRLFINSRIVASEGFTPGTIHKTIDSTNHDIVLMAEPATPIADMVKDGVILAYMKHDDNTLYSKMYMKRDEATKKDVLTFEDPIDVSNVDIPIRIVGSDSPDFTSSICPIQYQGAYKNVKGFDSNYILTWKPYTLYGSFLGDNIGGSAGWKMEYFRMPNLTHFESRSELIRNIKSLKSVNFENLEFINSELYASEKRIIPVCTGCTSLTDVNFTQLKVAYCNLLTGCAAERLGFPNLEIVQSLTNFPNLVDISLQSLTSVLGDLLSDCPKLKVVKLPMLETCGGDLLSYCGSLEEISLPKLQTANGDFLKDDTTLQKIELPEFVTANGDLLVSCPSVTEISLPKLKKAGARFCNDMPKLKALEAPQLEEISRGLYNVVLETVSLPSLKKVTGNYLIQTEGMDSLIKSIDLPLLESVTGTLIDASTKVETLSFPKLQTVGGDFLAKNQPNLSQIELPNLESVGGGCVTNISSPALTELSFPKLKTVGKSFANSVTYLAKVSAPLLESTGENFCNHSNKLTYVNAPSLKTVGRWALYNDPNLVYADFGALTSVGKDFICSSSSIKTIIIRSNTVPTISGNIGDSKPSDCILYVPDDMISKYLADSKWSAAFDKDHIKPISEAPQPPV